MRKKIIQLPKGYLSYSQVQLWQNDPARYRQIYMDGREELRHNNAGMEYGKQVATALEKGTDTDDLLTDSAMLLLPKYDIADQEIRVDMKTRDGVVPIVGRPDTLDSVTKAFREYKTGRHPWTQKKAQEHLQMRFYAMIIYLKYGVVLKEAWLDWIETFDDLDSRKISPTGHVESFKVTFTLKDILETMALTSKVAKEIAIAYAAHVPDARLIW